MSVELSTYVAPKDNWEFIREQAVKYSPINSLPEEILFCIFQFLSFKTYLCVSQKWLRLGSIALSENYLIYGNYSVSITRTGEIIRHVIFKVSSKKDLPKIEYVE